MTSHPESVSPAAGLACEKTSPFLKPFSHSTCLSRACLGKYSSVFESKMAPQKRCFCYLLLHNLRRKRPVRANLDHAARGRVLRTCVSFSTFPVSVPSLSWQIFGFRGPRGAEKTYIRTGMCVIYSWIGSLKSSRN
jgi:hypothetical protein